MIIIYKSKKIPFKHILIFALFIIAISFSIVFVYNNAFLYERPIANIIKTTIQNTEQTVDQYGNKDTLYTQHLVGEIQNGDKKGQHIYLINEYSDSGAYDEPYQNGNDVFVDIDKVKTENE